MPGETSGGLTTLGNNYITQHRDDILDLTAEEKIVLQNLETHHRKERRQNPKNMNDKSPTGFSFRSYNTTASSNKINNDAPEEATNKDKRRFNTASAMYVNNIDGIRLASMMTYFYNSAFFFIFFLPYLAFTSYFNQSLNQFWFTYYCFNKIY